MVRGVLGGGGGLGLWCWGVSLKSGAKKRRTVRELPSPKSRGGKRLNGACAQGNEESSGEQADFDRNSKKDLRTTP